jgi:hypothetical protein
MADEPLELGVGDGPVEDYRIPMLVDLKTLITMV